MSSLNVINYYLISNFRIKQTLKTCEIFLLPTRLLPPFLPGWQRFFLDDFGIWIVARLFGLSRLEVGHELVFIGLLYSGDTVSAGFGHPLLVFLVVLELLGERGAILTGGRSRVAQCRSVFKAQSGTSYSLPFPALEAGVLKPTALHGQLVQVLGHSLV